MRQRVMTTYEQWIEETRATHRRGAHVAGALRYANLSGFDLAAADNYAEKLLDAHDAIEQALAMVRGEDIT